MRGLNGDKGPQGTRCDDPLVMISSGMRAVLCQFWGTVVDSNATLDGINFKSVSCIHASPGPE